MRDSLIFRWLPVRHVDPRGNVVVFRWEKLGQLGCREIRESDEACDTDPEPRAVY
jgi:YD repeat-containing protein